MRIWAIFFSCFVMARLLWRGWCHIRPFFQSILLSSMIAQCARHNENVVVVSLLHTASSNNVLLFEGNVTTYISNAQHELSFALLKKSFRMYQLVSSNQNMHGGGRPDKSMRKTNGLIIKQLTKNVGTTQERCWLKKSYLCIFES